MSIPIPSVDPYWDVVVQVAGGATVTHTFSFENDALHYLAECQDQGYTAVIKARP